MLYAICILCFMVVTDNASNMKHAFETIAENDDADEDDDELEIESEINALQQWTV